MMKKIHVISDAEEARIQAAIAADPDAPEASNEDLARARPFADAFPQLAESARRRGRPAVAEAKQLISLRLDAEVIRRLRATGRGWQSRVNDTLKKAVGLDPS
ncbi:MAG: BrnA antitoxin family protein [Asticcacaulis sp.]|jgi:uncharacterized protein (DUF4415 family)|uniref:BrnA antitoxin family protein n=1 Tax=Asticcacaulis sp. TaxID=1872648 RepID=UPI003F7B8DA4